MLLYQSLGTLYIVCVFALYNMAKDCIDGISLLMITTRFDIVTEVIIIIVHLYNNNAFI